MHRVFRWLLGPKVPAVLLVVVLVGMALAWAYSWRQEESMISKQLPAGWVRIELDDRQPTPGENEGWYCFRRPASFDRYYQECMVDQTNASSGNIPEGSRILDQPESFPRTMTAVSGALAAVGTLLSGIAAFRHRQADRDTGNRQGN